jgi:cytochrome P450
LLSVLVSGEKQGVYTREEVLSNAVLLLVTGHKTTLNLLGNGTLAFIHHPDQWYQLKQDPAGRAGRATEECLRYDAPVKSLQRIAAEDVELYGKRLRKNDRVLWVISSANRDPEAFPAPDRFDIARDPKTGRRVPLFHPRWQRWSRHFAWSEDFMIIVGHTATGRVTVAALHLDRPELLNLRRVLRAVGEHPPAGDLPAGV